MRPWMSLLSSLRPALASLWYTCTAPLRSFRGSEEYWKRRYELGGHSGAGSYRKFAEFKASVLNEFVADEGVRTVIEYGCGDGNQLRLARYPSYVGFDVSPDALARCRETFAHDASKDFRLMHEYAAETADLTLSLDVIYHLTEDHVFDAYMRRLFDSSTRFVIVFSSNTDEQERFQSPHVRHRAFSAWVETHRPEWSLYRQVPNAYPYAGNHRTGSFADFHIYRRS